MRLKLTILLLSAMLLVSCGGKPAEEPVSVSDRHFYYKDTKWGMTISEVTAACGEPDKKMDNKTTESDNTSINTVPIDISGRDSSSGEAGGGGSGASGGEEPLLIDYYYKDKTLFDKYTVTELYLFDAEQKLEGVTSYVYCGTVEEDLSNLREVVQNMETSYLGIRDILTERFGSPNAEYTAYQEGGAYKTKQELDLDMEAATVCASRWDGELIGDNYRFIYIMYLVNDGRLELKYTHHSKETVDRVNAGGKP